MQLFEKTFIASLILLCAAGCTKEKNNSDKEAHKKLIEVSLGGGMQENTVTGTDIVWQKGDRIAIMQDGNSAEMEKASIYEIAEGIGKKQGKFRYVNGAIPSGPISKVFYPAAALQTPDVPCIQHAAPGHYDSKALRFSYRNGTGTTDDPIILKNDACLFSFVLTGKGEKISEITFSSQKDKYTLEVSDAILSDKPLTFFLILPPLETDRNSIHFKAQTGEQMTEMKKELSNLSIKTGQQYQFQPLNYHGNRAYSDLNLAFYNVAVFSKNLPDNPKSEGHIPAIASMMKEKKIDAMMLAELDKNNKRHDYDQLEAFASKMGWNHQFAKAFNYGGDLAHWHPEYGIGAAYDKKYKVMDSFTLKFPKYGQEREDRVCLVMEYEHFILAGTHLPLYGENSLEAAKKITAELKSRYGGKDKPVFLCGDMNAKPQDPTLLELKKTWIALTPEKFTCPATNPTKCLDYILALKDTGLYEVTFSEVCDDFRNGDVRKTSDHLPVKAVIRYFWATSEQGNSLEAPTGEPW